VAKFTYSVMRRGAAAATTLVVPETLESSLTIAGVVLQPIGVPEPAALQRTEQERERRIGALRRVAGGRQCPP
jgi:hypothetical protein